MAAQAFDRCWWSCRGDAAVAARTSGQAWPIGWSEPARPFTAEQRLTVL